MVNRRNVDIVNLVDEGEEINNVLMLGDSVNAIQDSVSINAIQ